MFVAISFIAITLLTLVGVSEWQASEPKSGPAPEVPPSHLTGQVEVSVPPQVVQEDPLRERGDAAVEEKFSVLLGALGGLEPRPVRRSLSDMEKDFVLEQIQQAVRAIADREREVSGMVGELERRNRAFLCEKHAVTFAQIEALEREWFVIGRSGLHAKLLKHAAGHLHDTWYNLRCNLPDGDEIIFLLPFWPGSTVRSAFDEARRIRRSS